MKKLSIVLLMLAGSMAWVSCKKSKNTTVDPVYTAGIHAKVNGVNYTAQYVNKISATGAGHYSIQFDGPDSTTHIILSIELPDFTGRGVRNLTATSADKAYYEIDRVAVPIPIYATSGQVNITALNDTAVGGTFYFTAGSNTITDGTFNVSF
jgi:hypothetical protein